MHVHEFEAQQHSQTHSQHDLIALALENGYNQFSELAIDSLFTIVNAKVEDKRMIFNMRIKVDTGAQGNTRNSTNVLENVPREDGC